RGALRLRLRRALHDPREPLLDARVIEGEHVACAEAEARELLLLREAEGGVRAAEQLRRRAGRERRGAQQRAAVREVDLLPEAALDGPGAVRVPEPAARPLGDPERRGRIVQERVRELREQLR